MFDSIFPDDYDLFKGLSHAERMRTVLRFIVMYFVVLFVTMLLMAVLFSCASPKTVEQHEHHQREADSIAVEARIDRRLSRWQQQTDSIWTHRLDKYSASWTSHEDQKEVITETVTIATDSLGREVRQEQRRIERAIENSQSSMVNSIKEEYESRLRTTVDSLSALWQQRFDSLATHQLQQDSTSYISHQPSNIDNRPWYRRWLDTLRTFFVSILIAIALIIAIALWLTRSKWLKLFQP